MKKRRQYCLTLDLNADKELARQYEEYHKPGNVWLEVIDNILESGILDMQIYRSGTQLIMVMTVMDSFSFEDKARRDSQNPRVVEWERLMARFQHTDNQASAVAKWQVLSNIFDLEQH